MGGPVLSGECRLPESIRVSAEGGWQDAYAEREEQFLAPERRSVFHIFLL